mmetsp:Transcript_11707/g.21276  ORF Transcript_11707/g.21276 Transcript_11707/m.21276 type:complete len:200 (+) Transcript_11707:165-764(+)
MKQDHFSMSSAFRNVIAKCLDSSCVGSTISQKTSSATTLLPSCPARISTSTCPAGPVDECLTSMRLGKTLTFISFGFQSSRTGILAPTSCFVWYHLNERWGSSDGALLDREPSKPDSGDGVAKVLTWIGTVHGLRPQVPTAHMRIRKSVLGAKPLSDAFNTLLGKKESFFFLGAGANVPWSHSTSCQESSLTSEVQEQT